MLVQKWLGKKLPALEIMGEECVPLPLEAFCEALQKYARKKDFAAGKRLHAALAFRGMDTIIISEDHLIHMFASCGSFQEADRTFCRMPKPSMHACNALILAAAKAGHFQRTIGIYWEMERMGLKADRITFLGILKACATAGVVDYGRIIHDEIIMNRLESHVVIGSSLVNMYAKCGRLADARLTFDSLPSRTVVAWGGMIAGYTQHRYDLRALELYDAMQLEGIKPDALVFSFALKSCTSIGTLRKGRLIHEQFTRSGIILDVVVGNTLVDMYAKWGHLEDADCMFKALPSRTVVSWSTMIAGYADCGHDHRAFEFFGSMQLEGTRPDKVAFLCALKVCCNLANAKDSNYVHAQIIEAGLELDMGIRSNLILMYAKSAMLEEANRVLITMPDRTLVSLTALMRGYTENGFDLLALQLLQQIIQEGIEPDSIAFLCTLKACGNICMVQLGRLIHHWIFEGALQLDVTIGNSLVDMYANCGSLKEACQVFDTLGTQTVVSWTAMIEGYTENGDALYAAVLFDRMKQEDIEPTKVTYVSILKACNNLQTSWQGRQIHAAIIRSGFESDVGIGSSLVDMYARQGRLDDARKVFDSLPIKNVVLWGAMIFGYAQHGCQAAMLDLYIQMMETGMNPSRVMFLSNLRVCGSIGAMEHGRLVHDQIVRSEFWFDEIIGNALVDMYIKCGSLEEAHRVFNELPSQSVVSWGTMIAGYALYGNGYMARKCFEDMQWQGITPNKVVLTSILGACCHSGLLNEGCWFFECFKSHGMAVDLEHYSCMVDLLGRTGHMKEAEYLIQVMPVHPNLVMWVSLLTSCKSHGNFDTAVTSSQFCNLEQGFAGLAGTRVGGRS